MNTVLRPALTLFLLLSLICGVGYPLAVTGIGRIAFAAQADGSLVAAAGTASASGTAPIGSRLIGQAFSAPRYFWSRPSATSPMPNNGASSSGANLGPDNPALIDAIKGRIAGLKAADPTNTAPIPVDLVTASASGLDPDISVAAAYYQAPRVARERRLDLGTIRTMIDAIRSERQFGFLGEPTVNVLALNLVLDRTPATTSEQAPAR